MTSSNYQCIYTFYAIACVSYDVWICVVVETIREVQRFQGLTSETDHFKTMLIEDSYVTIGAR